MTLDLLNRGAYVGVLSSWSLAYVGQIIRQKISQTYKKSATSQEENLFQPAAVGRRGFVRRLLFMNAKCSGWVELLRLLIPGRAFPWKPYCAEVIRSRTVCPTLLCR